LQVAQQRLALAQSVTKSGIWDWEIPSGTLFWTPEMYRLFGLDGTTTTVGLETWRTAVHPDDIADVENRTRRAIGRRQPMFSEFRIVLPDRSVRWIRAHGNALYDADGSPRRMFGLCLDVTDLNHLSASAADANAANPAKNMYLAMMSHELRTPLNSILGFTSVLLDGVAGEINEEQARQLAIVKRSGQQLLELVAEILDFAKAEAGKLTLELVAVPLKRLLLEQHEALRPIAEARGIALDPPECDDDLVVRADAQRLSQVVRNLLANSAKFTDHGRISVKARLNDAFVRVEVEDTGIGIAADEIGGLFTPFRRSDDPRSASRGGTGLGLSISRSMVVAMGGEITVESVPGLGSTFSITLPAYAGLP
jgi:PAS domain S-box-containing protein